MHGPGHVGASLLSYAPVGTALLAAGRDRLAVAGGLVAIVCAPLPDLDELLPGVPHRGPTHTLWFVVAVAAGLSAVSAAVTAVRDRPSVRPAAAITGLAGFLSLAVHVAVDSLTPMGIRPLAPVRDRHVGFDVVLSRDRRANRLFLVAGVAATAVGAVVGRLLGARRERTVVSRASAADR